MMDVRQNELRAFVLCGGLGTRLRSVLSARPKSMALVAGVPFLELILKQLRGKGIRQIVLGTGYLAEQIESYFRDGSGFDLQIQYSREEKPLGTGGALKLAAGLLSDPFLVLNGDSYVEWSLAGMSKLLDENAADAVMALHEVPELSRYGSVAIDSERRVLKFVEKGDRSGAGWINAGVYLMRRELVTALPAGKPISLEKDVFPGLLGGRVYGLPSTGLFIDIGIPADLERAQTLLAPAASDVD